MLNKNLIILTVCQIFSFTAPPITVFISGIVGLKISPIASLATLPTSLSIVGTAVFSFFAAKIMSKIGRKNLNFMFFDKIFNLVNRGSHRNLKFFHLAGSRDDTSIIIGQHNYRFFFKGRLENTLTGHIKIITVYQSKRTSIMRLQGTPDSIS